MALQDIKINNKILSDPSSSLVFLLAATESIDIFMSYSKNVALRQLH